MGRSTIIDLTGMRFGKLTVLEICGKSSDGRITWLCKCDCGNEKVIRGHDLKNGSSKSCGCVRSGGRNGGHKKSGKLSSANNYTRQNDRLYRVWASIVQRCENKNSPRYADYGGRGIKMCDAWRNDFEQFKSWAINNGYDETAPRGFCTIDRVDNDGDYCPENCRWVTMKEQCNNKRNNRVLTCDGETHTLQEWAEQIGMQDFVLRDRIFKLGWSVEEAIKTPVRHFYKGKRKAVVMC